MKYDLSQIKLRVNINASIEKVYACWASSAALESWFLRKSMIAGGSPAAAQKGDEYEWFWHGYGDEVSQKGKFLEANGKDRIGFTFGGDSQVTVALYRECDETIVELVERGLPEDEYKQAKRFAENSKGWIFYLTNLKSLLEGGIDLRNRKVELHNVITA